MFHLLPLLSHLLDLHLKSFASASVADRPWRAPQPQTQVRLLVEETRFTEVGHPRTVQQLLHRLYLLKGLAPVFDTALCVHIDLLVAGHNHLSRVRQVGQPGDKVLIRLNRLSQAVVSWLAANEDQKNL